MKKIKKCMIAIVVFATVIISSTGCESKPIMDEDKCAEVALEYMKTKYHEDFEVTYSQEVRRYIGKTGYAEVDVKVKGQEKEYCIMIYPDGEEDTDKDGYYDSYKVISDDYMCGLVEESVKVELDNIINEIGINRFISCVYVEEIKKIKGFHGFSSDFYITNGNDTLEELLKNKKIYLTYCIEIAESEYNDSYETYIKDELKKLISEDTIYISIRTFSEEEYVEREQQYLEGGYESLVKRIGIKNISFIVEEETNESK